jgi:hypothetical protein
MHALSALFSILKDNIRCVVLNACYSEKQARAIAEHIECVIGMSNAIGDLASIDFSVAFYRALAYGRDVKTAFDLGCLQIDFNNLNEQDVPKLLSVNINPKELLLVTKQLDTSARKTTDLAAESKTKAEHQNQSSIVHLASFADVKEYDTKTQNLIAMIRPPGRLIMRREMRIDRKHLEVEHRKAMKRRVVLLSVIFIAMLIIALFVLKFATIV